MRLEPPRPKKSRLFGAILLATLFTTATQAAEGQRQLGGKGTLVLSAERMVGFSTSTQTTSSMGMDTSQSSTSFSVLGNPFVGLGGGYSFPRIALDGFVGDSLTIGGSIAFFRTSLSSGAGGASAAVSGFLLAPRVGFAAPLSSVVTFWGRAGLTYLSMDNETTTTSLFALTLEAPFVLALAPHVALSAGPTLDLGLTGSRTAGAGALSASVDEKATDLGVQLGLVGFF